MGIHNKIILAGAIGTEERWSVNLSYGAADTVTAISGQDSLQGWADGIADVLVDTSFTALTVPLWACLSGSGVLQTITAQYMGPDGKVAAQAVTNVSKVGTSGLSKPYPTSVVCSLGTGLPGASKRGRFYWPGLGCTIGNNGRLQGDTHPESLVTGFRALLSYISTASDVEPPMVPVVYSPTLGTYEPVVTLRVGDVPDLQSRRRDTMQENYSSLAYAQ
uniref:Uncharacterized protein n=1 Tax=uncultured prokaryote TaxID=198431 RepID=A0A0H5Q5E6_9ZZZZ|nr:hypothetical protein [uncultured prokaryote]